ncbi:winged helix DNA-binding domain-containing protein [Sorangium sp. So ce233]|uniref:winged helix DNA-binding domain-containing protein n=1 Tax=Sorangium sp. So ce233 TaxID=3133290 RepID=UPI003F629BF1
MGRKTAGAAGATPLMARRLSAQQIARPERSTPADVVSWLVAVQAQDPAAARWAVGVRLPRGAATEAGIDRALAEGSILRTHVLRWTWQLVSPADVRWLLALVAPRLIARYERRHLALGLDPATFRRSNAALEKALRDGRHLTRDELVAALESAGIPARGPRLSHLLGRAELDGLVCSGAPRDRQATHALLDLRAPGARPPLPRGEALAELAQRYFRSRGPATVADFAWWAGLTAAEARAGLAAVESTLVAEVVDGETTWRSDAPPAPAASPAAHLLPGFDEYLVAYRNRDAVLAPEHARRINAGGGMLDPCIVIDGRVAGVWRRALARRRVAIEVTPFEPLSKKEQQAVADAAQRYGEFLGLEVELTLGA